MLHTECHIDAVDLTEQLIRVLPPTDTEQAGEQLTQVSFQLLNTDLEAAIFLYSLFIHIILSIVHVHQDWPETKYSICI